jgi:hypothetical protein
MDFSRSQEGKEENPINYYGFCARERKNTFHITIIKRHIQPKDLFLTLNRIQSGFQLTKILE